MSLMSKYASVDPLQKCLICPNREDLVLDVIGGAFVAICPSCRERHLLMDHPWFSYDHGKVAPKDVIV